MLFQTNQFFKFDSESTSPNQIPFANGTLFFDSNDDMPELMIPNPMLPPLDFAETHALDFSSIETFMNVVFAQRKHFNHPNARYVPSVFEIVHELIEQSMHNTTNIWRPLRRNFPGIKFRQASDYYERAHFFQRT